MKKLVFAVFFIAAVVIGVNAQEIPSEQSSEYYYVSVYLEKVYPTTFGYICVYRRGVTNMGYLGIPNDWFTPGSMTHGSFSSHNPPQNHDTGTFVGKLAKAEIINLPKGKNWPYLSIFYKEGEFSHVRLYVHKERSHTTWGNVPLAADVSRYFEDPESIKILY